MEKRMLALPATVAFTYPGAAGGESITLDLGTFPDHILVEAIRHGLQQKGADCVSDAKKRGLSESAAKEEVDEALGAMKAGTWNKKGGGPRITSLEQYIAREAMKVAKARVAKEGDRYFGKDAAAVAKLYVESDAAKGWRDARGEEWKIILAERAKAKEIVDDLGDLEV